MAEVQKLNSTNFNSIVKAEGRPVLVSFFAPWCGYCRMQFPIMTELADDMGEKATIAAINIDDCQDKAVEYGVNGVPSLFIFKDGKIVYHQSGLHKREDLKELLEKYI